MSTDDQSTADLRRAVRRCTESATHEQLEAMQEGWTFAADHEYRQTPIMRDGAQVGVLSVPVKAGEPTMARYDEDPLGERAARLADAVLGDVAALTALIPRAAPMTRADAIAWAESLPPLAETVMAVPCPAPGVDAAHTEDGLCGIVGPCPMHGGDIAAPGQWQEKKP